MARAEAVRTDSYYEPPLELPVHAAAFETPSKAETVGFVGEAIEIGPRLSLSGTPDWELLGEAVHGFFSADRPGFPAEERLNLAGRLLERWHVALALRPGDLMLASDRLWAWGNSCWPNATWRREWPIFQRRVSGAVVRGRADLVIDAGDGFVVVDHKSFQGRVDDAIKRARAHAGQLDAYATAISEATSKACLGRFVYLPLLGRVVPVAGDVSTWAYGFLPKIAASLPPSARGARGGK